MYQVDYILFITAPVTIKPNPNEVCDVKWVDADQLRELMETLDCECIELHKEFRSIHAMHWKLNPSLLGLN